VGQAPKFNCPLHLDQPAQKEQAKPLAVLDLAGHRFHDLTQELVHLLALPGEPALNTLPTGKSLCRPLSGRGFNYLALLQRDLPGSLDHSQAPSGMFMEEAQAKEIRKLAKKL